MFNSLKEWRQLYHLLLLMAFLSSLFAGSIYAISEYRLLDEQLNKREAVLETAANQVSHFISSFDYEGAVYVARALLSRPDIARIVIKDSNGFELVDNLTDPTLQTSSKAPLVFRLSDIDQQLGEMKIWLAQEDFFLSYSRLLVTSLAIFVLVFITSAILLFWFMNRSVIKPLNELSLAIDATMEIGDPVKTSFDGSHYLGSFANQFNAMQETISKINLGLKEQTDLAEGRARIMQKVLGSIEYYVRYYDDKAGTFEDCSRNDEIASVMPEFLPKSIDELTSFLHENDLIEAGSVKLLEPGFKRIDYEIEFKSKNDQCLVLTAIQIGPDGAVLIARDVTRTRIMQRSLERAGKLETIGLLANGIAHDFNNVMGIVAGNLELLKHNLPNKKAACKHIDQALKGINRGEAIVTSLLSFSRPSPDDLEDICVMNLYTNVYAILADTIGSNINIEIGQDIKDTYVTAKKSILESALINLVVNARDAMPNGGNIQLTCETIIQNKNTMEIDKNKQDARVLLNVLDEGTGVSDEIRENLFVPFFTTKEFGIGSGLGLTMVKEFAENSGGNVYAENMPAGGLKVTIELPGFIGKPFMDDEPDEALEPIENYSSHKRPLTIWVLEDQIELAELIAEVLTYRNHKVRLFPSLKLFNQAIKKMDTLPDVILTDLNLDDGSGTDLLSITKLKTNNIPIALISGNLQHGVHSSRDFKKFACVMKKPLELASIADKLEEICQTPVLH